MITWRIFARLTEIKLFHDYMARTMLKFQYEPRNLNVSKWSYISLSFLVRKLCMSQIDRLETKYIIIDPLHMTSHWTSGGQIYICI